MNKSLILVVVTALAMAGGQADAATCENTTVGAIESHGGFFCTNGDLEFFGFDFADVPGSTPVSFGPDSVSFHSLAGPSSPIFFLDYHLRVISGLVVEATLDQTVPTPTVETTFHPLGFSNPSLMQINSGTQSISLGSGVRLTSVFNDVSATSGAHLDTLTESFATVPEPTSLSLFGLGLAGLWFARRRVAEGRKRRI